jgi:hypothetical protein
VTGGIEENAQKLGHDKINYFFFLLSTVYKKAWPIHFGACFTLVAGVV